ncbi:MAG: M1 family metallopeptidase [Flavobacteriales bacterium]|nr:M1 family metallopeptidase [Flavobacteriales bacterium]
MKNIFFYGLSLAFLLSGCYSADTKVGNNKPEYSDPHSFSFPDEARVKHLDIDLKVDFNNKQLVGKAVWQIETAVNAKEIIFDTYGLDIEKVTLGKNEQSSTYTLSTYDPVLGSALHIPIDSSIKIVSIYYHTTDSSHALQWLEPEQTSGGKNRFLFTQSQAILARSWIPTQDSPGIRFTYTATVHTPKGYLALMSARNPQAVNEDGYYTFEQPYPIPSYLMALAVGVISFESIGERCGVYAEPDILTKAHYELAETEDMLKAAELLYGAYAWERYDILILPPSFPFGGMENPMLTFATPTILAGDRSLTTLIAHELAHSWSGNLVTNASWNDFWLNEGFTVYVERRIMEALYGKNYADMLSVLGYQDLLYALEEIKTSENLTDGALVLSLDYRNPDDAIGDVAYEKGAALLTTIEQLVGRERFDPFLTSYFKTYAFSSVNTNMFVDFLYSQLLKKGSEEDKKLNLDTWLHTEKIPNTFIQPVSIRFIETGNEAHAFLAGKAASDLKTSEWTSHEWQYFLRYVSDSLTYDGLNALDKVFHLTQSENAEIAALWYKASIRLNYKPCFPQIEKFLGKVGRRKFLEPLYQALLDNPVTEKWGRGLYQQFRFRYHSVTQHTLDLMMQ